MEEALANGSSQDWLRGTTRQYKFTAWQVDPSASSESREQGHETASARVTVGQLMTRHVDDPSSASVSREQGHETASARVTVGQLMTCHVELFSLC